MVGLKGPKIMKNKNFTKILKFFVILVLFGTLNPISFLKKYLLFKITCFFKDFVNEILKIGWS